MTDEVPHGQMKTERMETGHEPSTTMSGNVFTVASSMTFWVKVHVQALPSANCTTLGKLLNHCTSAM